MLCASTPEVNIEGANSAANTQKGMRVMVVIKKTEETILISQMEGDLDETCDIISYLLLCIST